MAGWGGRQSEPAAKCKGQNRGPHQTSQVSGLRPLKTCEVFVWGTIVLLNTAKAFFTDREYFSQVFRLALPIAIQNLIMSSLNLVSVMMIGQLGEAPIAAVGLANQMFFLLQLVLFGINSGSAIFTAQLWGKGDVPNIRKVLSLALMLGLSVAGIFLALARLAPQVVLGIYSTDPEVVTLGSEYLMIFGLSFPFIAITFTFAAVLRSTGNVRTPMVVSLLALGFNTVLSYALIFGKFGLPEMGTRGAATAGLVARILECSLLLGTVYLRRMPIAVRLADLLALDLSFAGQVFKPILPVILNETFWSFGITAYNVVYARMGTDAIATMNIVAPIENMAFVLVSGLANGTAIMVGNRIGAGEEQRAYRFGGRSITLTTLLGLVIGSQLLLWAPYLLEVYKVSPEVVADARWVLAIMGCMFWVRAGNAVIIVGILRSGGDTLYSFILDGLIIWLVGVPSAIFTAFVLDWPVYLVYLAILSEEILKWSLGMRRYFSRKWIHNLAQTI